MFRTLREFLTALEREGELKRIAAPVSSILEISEIVDRMSQAPAPRSGAASAFDPDHADAGGYALLFENVADVNSSIPVAINVFGSYRRMEMALGCHRAAGGFESIAARIASIARPAPPRGVTEFFSRALELAPLLLRVPPRRVRRGRCQEIVKTGDRINLLELPIIKCWPLDGDLASVGVAAPPDQPDTSAGSGRFITFAGMHTIHADDAAAARPASRNIGMYRAQVIDDRRLAMHWHMHHDGAAHWRSWKARGEPMPVAIVFGGESVLPYAATAPLPPGVSELLMAGFLNGRGIPLVRCRTVPLDVPANAEIVIEGFVSTQAEFPGFDPANGDVALGPGAVLEGPFGDHTGFYSLPDRYPIVNVTAITSCASPILPATIVGLPLQEDYYMGKATERLFLPLLRVLIPDIVDYDLPKFGAFHNCAFVQIRKSYPLHARRVMSAIWGAGQMSWTKVIVVVDDDVNVHRLANVLRAIASNVDFERDLEIVNGPLDILDHAAPRLGAGGKVGIDATRKIPGEEIGGVPIEPAPAAENRVVAARIDESRKALTALRGVVAVNFPFETLGRLAIVSIEKSQPHEAWNLMEAILTSYRADDRSGPDAVITVSAAIDVNNLQSVFFHACANSDPKRDLLRVGRRIGLDATPKTADERRHGEPVRPFPPILRMSDEVRDRVTRHWPEYGLGHLLPPVEK